MVLVGLPLFKDGKMDKVVIFNGFQTVEIFQMVDNLYTIIRHKNEVLCGSVIWENREIHVEYVGNEWWGRTT